MRRSHVLFHMVRADFLERVRRYSFLLTLGFAVYLGYVIYAGQIHLQLDRYQGVANAAWRGSVIGLVASVFLSLIGFYVVKNTIQRDRETRVGRILAATPMSKTFYTFSKALSNFAVLAAMIVILAVAALVIQWAREGAGSLRPVPLLSPLLIFGLCALSVTSAFAVLFESIPGLRGGLGNVVYFFLWGFLISISVRSLAHGRPDAATSFYDYTGIATISGQMQTQVRELDPEYKGGSSFGIGPDRGPRKTFLWNGLQWSSALVLSRFLWVGFAVCLALLGSIFFDRFDPDRERLSLGREGKRSEISKNRKSSPLQDIQTEETQFTAADLTPLARSRSHNRFLALVIAELRLLLSDQRWWWYTIAAGLFLGCLFAPLSTARSSIILVTWLWPALAWSQLGTREAQFSTQPLIFSARHSFPRHLLSTWTAGCLLALVTGGGLGLHLLLARDFAGLQTWAAASCFIPALALVLGVWTESRKPFEALYTAWWYIGPLHGIAKLDFIGTRPSSSTPGLYLAVSICLIALACLWRRGRISHG